MPVSLKILQPQGTLVFLKTCETCGSDNAPFGIGCDYRGALKALDSGDKETAKKKLGKWYCLEDVPA